MRKEMGSGAVKQKMGTEKKAAKRPTPAAPAASSAAPKAPQTKAIPQQQQQQPVKQAKPKTQPRIDFVQRNIEEAAEQKSRAKAPHVASNKERIVEQRHAPGEIPDYIEARKEQIRAEHLPPPSVKMQPGMRLLTDEEKAESIADLTERKQEIETRLSKFSLRLESPTLLREKRMMEAELTDIETSLAQLKKKYVFVPEDE